MHIVHNRRRYKDKVYHCTLLREGYHEGGKSRQRTLANLTHLPQFLIRMIELAIQQREVTYTRADLKFQTAADYGHIAALDHLLRDTGLATALYSKARPERSLVEAMIIARILKPASKLENTRWLKQSEPAFREFSALNYGRLRVDDLYRALDWLDRRKERIEARLVQLRTGQSAHGPAAGRRRLFLYDTTSSYFEGDTAEGAEYGYSRDERSGNKQIVIGLVCDEAGYPLAIETFAGNTADAATLLPQVRRLQERFGVKDGIMVGDRGMIKQAQLEELGRLGFGFITALTHQRLTELVQAPGTPFQLGLFDESGLVEVEYEKQRHVLCRNPDRAQADQQTLDRLMKKTQEKLKTIKQAVRAGRLKSAAKIGVRVGRWQNRWQVGKYFAVEVGEGSFEYRIKVAELALARGLAGCYVVVTSAARDELTTQQVVEQYKQLQVVERAFRALKTTLLEIRPMYHRRARRIRAHALICMLAYYLVVELRQRLAPLFDENGEGRDYVWTLESILTELGNIKLGWLRLADIRLKQISELNQRQRSILRHLGLKLTTQAEVETLTGNPK